MITKYAQSSMMVNLPDEHYLRVVVRNGTPAFCVLRGNSSSNTSYALQIITSVEESPLCSPEQRPDCLPSTHVNYNDSDYFGISVWSQKNSSSHYLIVNENTELVFQKNLTNASFKLQSLWYNAFNCEVRLVAVIVLISILATALLCCVLTVAGLGCFLVNNVQVKRWRLYTIGSRDGDNVILIPLDEGNIVMAGVSLLAAMFTSALVIGITAETTCPPKTFTNISITPCNYNELKDAQASMMVTLPDGYYLRVVVRHGTPALCVLRSSFTSTSYTLHIIASVKGSPLCSPEQRLDCLPSTCVRYNNNDYFGISVWSQKSSSLYYLIVNENDRFTVQKDLTHASFDLYKLWHGALHCDSGTNMLLQVIMFLPFAIIILIFGLLKDTLVYYRIRLEWRTKLQDQANTAIDMSWPKDDCCSLPTEKLTFKWRQMFRIAAAILAHMAQSYKERSQYGSCANACKLTSVTDDLRGSNDSLVSTTFEKGKNGNCCMVGPRHSGLPYTDKLGATSSSGSSSDERVSSDSSSDDDSNPPSNIQEESTADVPPPHYARCRMHAVYENPAGGTGVPRPPPQGSGFDK